MCSVLKAQIQLWPGKFSGAAFASGHQASRAAAERQQLPIDNQQYTIDEYDTNLLPVHRSLKTPRQGCPVHQTRTLALPINEVPSSAAKLILG